MNTTDDAPRYATLRDYLGVLRRHRILIAVVAVGFVAAALLISVAQTKKYEATAQLQVNDVSQLFQFVAGGDVRPITSPPQRAAITAQLVGQPQLARQVKKTLAKKNHGATKLSLVHLQNAVSGAVSTQTLLVTVTASATTPQFAATLANAWADQVARTGSRQANAEVNGAAKSLQTQIDALKGSTDPLDQVREQQLQSRLTILQAAQDVANPVQVVQRATRPTSPTSPDTRRNLVLGAVVGLFFGVLGAFLRDSLDRRLHTVSEIHQEIGLPVLGRVSDTAMGYPGLATNGRVAMAETDFEAFRILRTNLAAICGDDQPRSLMVTSGLPEEGKSTVSMSLASAAALAGQRVLLVECDLRRPSFATRFGVNREPGLSDYLTGRSGPQEVLQSVELHEPAAFTNGSLKPRSNRTVATLVVITAGTPASNPAELLISDRFKDFLAKVTRAYDLVVLDTSPLLAVADPLELAPQVDGVLVCVRAQRATRDEARATRVALAYMAERPIGAVVTGLRRGGGDPYEYYYGE